MIKKLLLGALVVSSFPALLLADAISPTSVTASIDVGESYVIHKTVTISDEAPTTTPVDVMFLTDATGSMSGLISSVKTSASNIMASVAPLGDVQFAAGSYRDLGDAYTYRLEQGITSNTAAVQSGINTWTAGGGGDWPECNLYALEQAAGNATGWRAGAEKIVVWFGDAAGHDPRLGSTEVSAIAALQAQGITVLAMNTSSSTYYNLDSYGQATRIAAATGGTYYSSINTSSIVSEITSAITTAIDEYSVVDLEVVGADNVTVTTTAAHTGSFDRSVVRTFEFDVTVTGASEGVDDFEIYATVDGGRVALETDRFTVGSTSVPEPGTFVLFSLGLISLAGCGIRRRK